MYHQPILQTSRLWLRPFSLADAGDVQRLAGSYQVAYTTANIPHPYEDGMAETWISSHARQLAEDSGVVYAVTLRATGVLCGAITLMLSLDQERAELGYWMGVSYWGRGFCTEAAREMLRFGFQELDLYRIVARHLSRNPASGRVMQKIGMQHEGRQRGHLLKWGVHEDIELYGLLRSEWEAQIGS